MPRTRSLLQAVERLVQPAHHVRARGVHKPRRLTAVDGLGEVAVQEGVLHVQLVHRPGYPMIERIAQARIAPKSIAYASMIQTVGLYVRRQGTYMECYEASIASPLSYVQHGR